MALTTDFNVTPYYDDYSEDKDFYRILFRPGYSLQAREVTQLQTILQKQIERNGSYLFEDGQRVTGANITLDTDLKSVKLQDAYEGTDITADSFDGQIVTGGTSSARAYVVKTDEATATDYDTLYVQYLDEKEFSNNEIVTTEEGTTFQANTITTSEIADVVSASGNTAPSSNASIVSIDAGVYYIGGFFVRVAAQTLVLEKYSKTPSYRVGLEITESFVDYNDDSSLLDTAQGTENYTAPGANRYKIVAALAKKQLNQTDPIENAADANYLELFRLNNGIKLITNKYPGTTELEKTLARRTEDESGDYTITPFEAETTYHRIGGTTSISGTGTITGSGTTFSDELTTSQTVFVSSNTAATTTISAIANNTQFSTVATLGDGTIQTIGRETDFSIGISGGKAYIKGYGYESPQTDYVTLSKSRDTSNVFGETITLDYGPYFKVRDPNGSFLCDGAGSTGQEANCEIVDLHMVKWPVDANYVFSKNTTHAVSAIDTTSAATIANTKIGTARVRNFQYSAAGANAKSSYIGRLDLFDMRFSKVTGTCGAAVANVSVVKLATSGASSFPTVNCLYNCTVTVNTTYLGSSTSDTRRITRWFGANVGATGAIPYGVDHDADGAIEAASSYMALLNSPLSQQTQSDSTYTVQFSAKDIESVVVVASTSITSGLNIDPTGKVNSDETANTKIFNVTDLHRSLLFPFEKPILKTLLPTGTTNTVYTAKRYYDGVTVNSTGGFSIQTDQSNERFYPGTIGVVSQTDIKHHIVSLSTRTAGTMAAGQLVDFSNALTTIGANTGNGRSMTISTTSTVADTLTFDSANTTETAYAGTTDIITTVNIQGADATATGIARKNLINGNTTVVNAAPSNTHMANNGQIHMGAMGTSNTAYPPVNSSIGANNSLFLADIKKIKVVIDSLDKSVAITNAMLTAAYTSAGGGTSNTHDITSDWILDTGQRDNYYDYGKISLKPGVTPPSGQVMAIVDYWQHHGDGAFIVDSYTFAISGNAAHTTNTVYTEIPTYVSSTSGESIELKDMIDYRPRRHGYESGAGNDITATANVFSPKVTPAGNFTATTDYNYYLPRKDKIILTRDRKLKVLKGISADDPQLPSDDEDSMTLYSISIPAYTFDLNNVITQYIEHKGYTMSDIGELEKRIERLEYYTAMNLLEKEADGVSITDANGNDRFKNGIMVDPFAGHSIGDVYDLDYYCAMDFKQKELTPGFNADTYSLEFDDDTSKSNNCIQSGGLVTLPYDHTSFIDIPLTGNTESKNFQKYLSVNPFAKQSYIGSLELDPPGDIWYDSSNRASVVVNLEGQNDGFLNIITSSGHGTMWNSWERIWSGRLPESSEEIKKGSRDLGKKVKSKRETTEVSLKKTGIALRAGELPEKIIKLVGNKLVDVSIVPYIRPQTLRFVAKGLKPNKNVYAFFDGVNITANVKQATSATLSEVNQDNVFRTTSGHHEQITIQGTGTNASNTANVLFINDRTTANGCTIMYIEESTALAFSLSSIVKGDKSGANGTISSTPTSYQYANTELQVSAEGVVAGVISIPSNKFLTGPRLLRLTDDVDNILSTTTSVAESHFHASGATQTRIDGIVSTRPPITRRQDPTELTIAKSATEARQSTSTNFVYPMAQTFFVDKDNYPFGVFATRLHLYFYSKASTTSGSKTPITVSLRPVYNGKPSSSVIIPFSEVTKWTGGVTANISTPVPATTKISANNTVAGETVGEFAPDLRGNSMTGNMSRIDKGSKTVFEFSSPVYLLPGEYAFVVQSNDPAYKLYAYDIGAKHTGTDRKITKPKVVGSFFKQHNATEWEPEPAEGLMFRLDRADFTFGKTANVSYARFKNSVNSAMGATSNTKIDVMKIMTSELNFANTSFTYSYDSAANGTAYAEATANYKDTITNKNIFLKQQQAIQYITNTTNTHYKNSFTVNTVMTTSNTYVSPILDVHKMGVVNVEYLINNGSLANSDIRITNPGTGYHDSRVGGNTTQFATGDAISGNTSVFTVSSPDISGGTTATIGANVHLTGTVNAFNQMAVVGAGSGYTKTPTVTVVGEGGGSAGSGATVEIVGETGASGGNNKARYISRRVTLQEGFDAKDLVAYISAYKPYNTDVHVYYKVSNKEDSENFEDRSWVKMTQDTAADVYSADKEDYKQFKFVSSDGKIEYLNTAGTSFEDFSTFAVKIVLTMNRSSQKNSINVPRVRDLRAIAVATTS